MFWKSLVLLLLLCVQNGLSIRCIDCNSANNSMCLEPALYDSETLDRYLRSVECRYGIHAVPTEGNFNFFCRKIVQSILHKHSAPELRVTRGCGWVRDHRHPERACYTADNDDHLETVCQCFTDECNGAESPGLRLGLLASGFLYVVLLQILL